VGGSVVGSSIGDISNVSNNISNTSISNIRDISNTSISNNIRDISNTSISNNIRDISNTNTNISNTSISNVIDIPLTNTPSSSLKVGDIIFLKKNQRIPADCLLIKTSDPSGSCFIRTDQLDGETDWKLRTSPHITQSLTYKEILLTNLKIFADKPHKDIYSFIGKLSVGYNSVGGVGVGGGSSGEGGVGVGSSSDNKDSDKYNNNPYTNTHTINTPHTNNNTPYTNNTTPHTTHTLYTTTTPLNLENMLWMNTVLATGYALCVVIYTGKETRAQLNTSKPKNKYGLIESELNTYSIFLCSVSISIACIFTFLRGVTTRSDATLIRFIVILSNVIPISLKVSIDWARYVYSRVIMTDKSIEGCIVRTSNLPEELGRIGYLLSDKTGTLTKNEMEMKKVHLGTVCYTEEDEEDIRSIISKVIEGGSGRGEGVSREGGVGIRDRCEGGSRDSKDSKDKVLDSRDSNKDSKDSKDSKVNTNIPNTNTPTPNTNTPTPNTTTTTNISSNIGKKKDLYTRVFELLRALSICHNVTPSEGGYQASSPDEIAIVKWTEKTGIKLINRTRNSMELLDVNGCIHRVKILHIFPFTSETKRMGIIVEYSGVGGSGSGVGGSGVGGSDKGYISSDKGYSSKDSSNKDSDKGYSSKDSSKEYINNTPSIDTNPNTTNNHPTNNHHTNTTNTTNNNTPTIVMYLKGADTVMRTRVKYNDWLDEEVDNMAREGLRTLVIAMKYLTVEEYKEFNSLYELASLSVNDRNKEMNSVLDSFQNNMTLLGLTGVEDKLQDNVRVSIESLRNAGIKVWMLTGDKIETACSIAVSSKLFRRSDVYCVVEGLKTREEGYETMCMLTGSVGIMGGDVGVGGVDGMGGGSMDGGVSSRDSNYHPLSNKDSNYRGVSNKDSKQHPFSNTTNKQHPFSNTTNKQHPFNTNHTNHNPHNNPHN
ncbi:putative E1-E2 ATPase, partial [Hamiltosporidium magnivora]